MADCTFCNLDFDKFENTIICETENFRVIPTVGSLVDGYVLIVTKLPIRIVAESLGAVVNWDDELDKVTIIKDNKFIEIFVGSDVAYINEEPNILDKAAFIENSRTYLPVRFVAEALDATVNWDEPTRKVTIIP